MKNHYYAYRPIQITTHGRGLAVTEPPRLNTSTGFEHIVCCCSTNYIITYEYLITPSHGKLHCTHCLPIDGDITFLRDVGNNSPRNMTQHSGDLNLYQNRSRNLKSPISNPLNTMFHVRSISTTDPVDISIIKQIDARKT
jgi:hypothetical protein